MDLGNISLKDNEINAGGLNIPIIKGDKGNKGDTGASNILTIGAVTKGVEASATITGESPNQVLNLVLPKGDTGETGETGNGIASIVKTSTVGLIDTYTITYTNGNITTYTVTNGEDADITRTEFEELKQENEDLKNNQLTNTPTPAISHYLADSADSRVRSIGLSGNSEQDKTNGYQLLHDGEATKTMNGITFTKNSDGSVLVNGTATANTSYDFFNKEWTEFSAGDYVLTGCPGVGSGSTYRLVAWKEGWSPVGIDIGTGSGVNLAENTKLRVQIVVASGITMNNLLFKPMLEKGTTKHPYEPYTGGQASPNPNYPQEIHSTGDSGSVNEKVQNRNLIEDIQVGKAWNNGVNSARAVIYARIKPNTQYAISYSNSNGADSILYFEKINKEDSTTIKPLTDFTSPKIITSTSTSNWLGIQVNKSNVTLSDIEAMNFQIEEGTTATDYVAHEEQNISIPTQQPMRAIGEYKDTFVKVDGTWYERHYIGSKMLNGSETYYDVRAWGDYYRVSINVSNAEVYTINNSHGQLCSHFNYNHEGAFAQNTQSKPGVFAQFRGTTGFSFVIEQSSVANWKAWLSNNNVELIYVLATPVDLPCTEEQTEALEALEKARTYKPVTHISSEDVVPATIDLTYVKDLETVINNLGGA